MPLSQIVSASIEDGAVAPVDLSSVAQYTGFKNRIINGAMVIDQRNAGASGTSVAPGYPVDRWGLNSNQASKFTWQQNAGSVTPPAGFTNYVGLTSSSAYTVTGNDYFQFYQVIEGFNIADFNWGLATAHPATLSFWVRSSLTGTFGGSIATNKTAVWVMPFTYTIASANTWTYITVSVTAPTATGGTNNDNTAGAFIRFGLGSAGTSVGGTAGVWTNAGNYIQPSGTVNVAGTNGATWYITGVQLEKGVTATSFDYRPYSTELQLCQRYYEAVDVLYFTSAWASVANQAFWKVTKRASPTIGNFVNGGSGGVYSSFSSGAPLGSQCTQIFQTGANSTPSGGYVTGSIEF
jgi:hypothetical protein